MINPDKIFGRLGNRLFQMAYIYAEFRKGNVPDIYIQDFNYFKDYEEEIKKLYGEGIGYIPYVSIHVRRGSNPINSEEPKYSENPFYIDLTKTDYYERAIALFPTKKFLVFSDDIEWCKEKWGNNPKFQIMEGTELEDFNIMSSCESHIIANSSFSWWSAFVSPNLGKTVVAPKEWFADGIKRVTFPDSWKII